METIGRQVWEEVAGGVGEGVVDIEELDVEPLGGELADEIGELLIDLEDGGIEFSVLGAGEHGGENEVGVGGEGVEFMNNGVDALDDVGEVVCVGGTLEGEVIGTGLQDDEFGLDALEFSVSQSPKDVMGGIATPSEVGGVPTVEVAVPVF